MCLPLQACLRARGLSAVRISSAGDFLPQGKSPKARGFQDLAEGKCLQTAKLFVQMNRRKRGVDNSLASF